MGYGLTIAQEELEDRATELADERAEENVLADFCEHWNGDAAEMVNEIVNIHHRHGSDSALFRTKMCELLDPIIERVIRAESERIYQDCVDDIENDYDDSRD